MQTEKSKNKFKQIEMMPLPRGGKREGAGRKPIAPELKKHKTVVMRVDERLVNIVERLKKEMANENHNLILKVAKTLDDEKVPEILETQKALNNLMDFLKPYAD